MRRRHTLSSYLLTLASSLSLSHNVLQVSARFDPYSLNGGLVSAVAGRDYVIIAGDTRLTDGGYQIQSRNYLDGRIWAATEPHLIPLPQSDAKNGDINEPILFNPDGSLRIPRDESILTFGSGPPKNRRWGIDNPFGLTLVGSAGCASDCEALKRVIRNELSDRGRWARPSTAYSSPSPVASLSKSAATASSASATTVATLLLHTLYSRRSFPYYSFCVLAGLDAETGTGQVHVYDAIGSHERVAVACAGTPGREMLQPILDRMFASARGNNGSKDVRGEGDALVRDGTALDPPGQRVGSISLRPPVGTCVNCDADEAVAMLLKAYRSVSEREIGTGDNLVIFVLRGKDDDIASSSNRGTAANRKTGGNGSIEVLRFPLKKH